MAVQLSVGVRNARLDAIETTIGTTPHFIVRTSAQPADCATADSGTAIIDLTLPSDWMAAAASGQKAKSGTWSGAATAAGTAGHFRVKESTNTTCHMQGDAGQGSGSLSFDNTNIANGQTVTINTFTLTDGNA